MYDIHFDLNDMHQTVEESDGEFWLVGESFSFDFADQIKADHDEDEDEDDDFAIIVRRNGCRCDHCGEIYPYAEPNQKGGGFKCWSCRNR